MAGACGVTQSTILRRASCLVLYPAVAILILVVFFEQGVQNFHFAQGLTNYGSGPG